MLLNTLKNNSTDTFVTQLIYDLPFEEHFNTQPPPQPTKVLNFSLSIS